jgi:hypothetical protein
MMGRAGQVSALLSHVGSKEVSGAAGGRPHVYVTITILCAEFTFMKEGQWVAGVVWKGRFSLVNFLPKI